MDRARRTHKSNKVRISLYIRELYEAVGQIVSDRVLHTVCTEFARVKLLF
jgi:lipoate synthase